MRRVGAILLYAYSVRSSVRTVHFLQGQNAVAHFGTKVIVVIVTVSHAGIADNNVWRVDDSWSLA